MPLRLDFVPIARIFSQWFPQLGFDRICFVEEIPAAISQGESLEEAKANLLDALKLVLECQRELAEKNLSPDAPRETLEFAEA
jgi:predicted RNase H-like HicB family nuclease